MIEETYGDISSHVNTKSKVPLPMATGIGGLSSVLED